jgi:hypothetical protein
VSLAFLFWLKNRHVLFGIAAALAFWTHFYTLIPIGIMFSWNLYNQITVKEHFENDWHWITRKAVFIPLVSPIVYETARLFLMRTSSAPTWGVRGSDLIISFITQLTFDGRTAVIMFALIIAGMVLIKKDRWFLIIIIGGTVVVSLVASYFIPFHPRYLIYLLPFLFLPLAGLFSWAFGKSRVGAICVLIGFIFMTLPQYPVKSDWRGLSEYLNQEANENDTIIIAPSYLDAPFEYYYHGKSRVVYADRVEELKESLGSFYIVTSDIYAVDPRVIVWLSENKKAFTHFNGVMVYKGG